jgi:hypothetical protein
MRYSWRSMLRTSRAAAGVLLLGGIGLTVPPQTRDMLVFLEDGRIWPAISFQLALVVLAGSAWFWSRAALAARFGINDRRSGVVPADFDWAAYTWLPRLMLAGGFLIGVVIAAMGRSPSTIGGAIVLGALSVVLSIVRIRGRGVDLPPAPRYELWAWLRGGARIRLKTLLRRAPYGAAPAVILLVLGLVPLGFGVVEAFTSVLRLPNRLAAIFPGPGIAVLLLGLMIGPLVALAFVVDGLTFEARIGSFRLSLRRPPVLSVLFLYIFVLVPALAHIHTIRVGGGGLAQRQPLDKIFGEWVATCAPGGGPVRPIIVAVSGGATRAGGSLGAAGAMTLLSLDDLPCRAKGLSLLRPTDEGAPLAGDALGPLLGGWLLNDIPRSAFDPIAAAIRSITGWRPNGGDSAEAIERAFEDLWSQLHKARKWDRPFLSLFYTDGAGTYRNGMPLWFANGTDATTGNRVITTPIAAPPGPDSSWPWPFRGARDFHTLMRADVSIATAINNTARFPYLEPFGEMLPVGGNNQVGSLVDGGYFENEGLQTALDLAGWLAAQSATLRRAVEPIIVQATGDGEPDVGPKDVMSCGNASDGPFIPDEKHSSWQILEPLIGLYHVRGGHSAVLLRQARDQFCGTRPRFVHFYLPSDHGRPVPLNWVLSEKTARFIWTAFTDQQIPNAAELKRLDAALAPDSP